LKGAGCSIPIISIATVAQPFVLEQAGPAAEGVYFTTTMFSADNPRTDAARDFVKAYESAYGKKPNYFAAFAYDTVRMIAEALKSVSATSDANAVRDALSRVPQMEGTVGPIRLDNDGDATFDMEVMQIKVGDLRDCKMSESDRKRYKKLRSEIVAWLASYLEQSGKKGFVIGLSGGIDSLTLSLLANEAAGKVGKRFLAIISALTWRMTTQTTNMPQEWSGCSTFHTRI